MNKHEPATHVRHFVRVPLEPTEEMLAAADGVKGAFDARAVWAAMIEAAIKRKDD